MINLLEEEYNATSGKYILHLTMGANDTVADLPSSTKPFNSSNYSCSFDYGEPAEGSTAVNEISGKLYTYGDGEWYAPEPAVEVKVAGFCDKQFQGIATVTVNDVVYSKTGDFPIEFTNGNGIIFAPGDEITITNIDAATANATVAHTDGTTTEEVTSYTVTEDDCLIVFSFEAN